MKRPENCPQPVMQAYFMVDEIDATLQAASAAGGETLIPKTEIPGVGHYGMFCDPEGIVVGLFQQQ